MTRIQKVVLVMYAAIVPAMSARAAVDVFAEYGLIDYEFNFADLVLPTGQFGDGLVVKDGFAYLAAGILHKKSDWFFSVSSHITQEGESQGERLLTDIHENQFIAATHSSTDTIERRELSLLAGRSFLSSTDLSTDRNTKYRPAALSLYAGYRAAQTDISSRTQRTGNYFGFGEFTTLPDQLFDGRFLLDLKYRGFFIGSSASLPLGTLPGQLTVSSILSNFKGELGQDFVPDPGAREPVVSDAKTSGRTIGYAFSIDYSLPITKSPLTTLSIAAEWSEQLFTNNQSEVLPDAALGDFSERFTRYRLRYSYFF